MIRPSDQFRGLVDRLFWEYVEKMDDGRMTCTFCGHLFGQHTSITRIQFHLSGVVGRGVKICGQLPQDVQDVARAAIDHGSSNGMLQADSFSFKEFADWIANFPSGETELLERGRFPETTSINHQPTDLLCLDHRRYYDHLRAPSENNDVIMNDVENMDRVRTEAVEEEENNSGRLEQPVVGASSSGGLRHNPSETRWSYDVFLSFRGEDTRKNFTDHLHSALIQAGIRTFKDNDLPRGEEISPQLLRTIEGSRISVVVFSTNYASSRWCLDELVKIMECRQKTNQVVLPIFYYTDPSDVRKQTGSYATAFDEHEENFKGEMEKVNRWREALTQAANLSGRVLHETNGYEAELIKKVVIDVACKLENKTLHVAKHPVGISSKEMNMVRGRTEPVEEHDVENSGRLVQPGTGARSSKRLKYSKTRGVPFPTSSNKPVGQAFEENTKVIWSLLMDDEVSMIGIYGMGGVGKTTILQHINNELIQRPDICDYVWWVTVSQDFSINRLQNLIAKHLDLDLSSEDDDLHRAAKLSEELRKNQKWILILDDLWNDFKLHEVGIPNPLKGCKLILTTRSQTVCDRIDCQHKIEVKPLFEGESWTLFKENLGRDIAFSDEVKGIAKAVARECAGLPLGIITVAGSLRGVDDLPEWRTTLKKLRESKFRDMDEKVFKVLRVSYDRLGDSRLQQCLLYCALFPEDETIEREELIGYLIDEGVIKGTRRTRDAFDEGHTMLNRLQYVCLLESDKTYCGLYVKMHDLIRDMVIHILQENSNVIVKCGVQLKELPDAEEWTENLKIVSLMQNEFEKIPSSHSPMCPKLSTLLLCRNHQLQFIGDSFFKQFHGLRVLDLSYTSIENLPDSVSDLVSLTALLLTNCQQLRYVPSLKKLKALKSLDLYGTSLEKMPQGMECLSNLRYFRITGCGEKEFPSGILPKICNLQVLALGKFPEECYTVEGLEVGCLGKLETLQCHFKGFSDFVEYFRSRDGIQSLSTYKILVGTFNDCNWFGSNDFPSKTVMLGNLSINRDKDFRVKFLNDIQGLYCESIDASLCDVLSLENATELEIIDIEICDSMESFVSSSWFCFASPPLPSHNGMFSRLKEFSCVGCNSMEKLFPLELLSYLINLEVIGVGYCKKMEEIIGTTYEESSTSNPDTELTLPKLKTLELINLPELKGICSAKLICDSLEEIEVFDCEKLKRMAISLPMLENGQPSPHPSLKRIKASPEDWWERVVEWEPPNAKQVLRPIVRFR